MKESTGELSMVVVTLLAIAGIALAVRTLVPAMKKYIYDKWDEIQTEVPAASGDKVQTKVPAASGDKVQ